MRISDWSSDVCSSDLAVFNGVNLLDTAGASPDVNTLSNLDGGTLTLSGQDLRTTINSLAGATLTTATNAQDILDAQYSNLESTVNAALGSLGAEVRALEQIGRASCRERVCKYV